MPGNKEENQEEEKDQQLEEKYPKPRKATPEEEELGYVPEEDEPHKRRPMHRNRQDSDRQERRDRDDSPPRRRRPSNSLGGLGLYKGYIVTGVTVIIIAYMMIGMVGVTKKDFTTNFQGVSATIEAINKDVLASKTIVDNTVAGIPDMINDLVAEQIDKATKVFSDWRVRADTTLTVQGKSITQLQADMSAVDDRVMARNDVVDENTAKIDELVGWRGRADNTMSNTLPASIAVLEARIVALEARREGSGSADVDELIDIDVRVLDEGFPTSTIDDTTIVSLKLMITNDSTRDVEDLVVSIIMHVEDTNVVSSFTITDESGDGNWYIRTTHSRAVEIRNSRADIDAGEEWRTYIDVKLTFAQAEQDGAIDIEARVLDYD